MGLFTFALADHYIKYVTVFHPGTRHPHLRWQVGKLFCTSTGIGNSPMVDTHTKGFVVNYCQNVPTTKTLKRDSNDQDYDIIPKDIGQG